jgi:pimeloyl-ACP methyl ester carboxylesterase
MHILSWSVGRRVRWSGGSHLLFATVLTLLAGCDGLRPVTTPIPTVMAPGCPGSDRLLVLLPGRGSGADSFERHAFVRAARDAGITADIIAADAQLGYYEQRVVQTRIEEDVILPGRARGVRRVWVGGISLGGLGSVITGYKYPKDVDGMLLVAPYLGPDSLISEIEAAGGLRAWNPPPQATDYVKLWSWLKGYSTTPTERPPLILAYGDRDRFVRAERLLAAVLPSDRVLTTPGGHDWATWATLWGRAIRHPLLQEALGAKAPDAPGAQALSECRGTR